MQRKGYQIGEIVDKTKGKVKQAVGDLTGNEELKQEGENEEFKGKLEGAVKDATGAAKDAKQALTDSVK